MTRERDRIQENANKYIVKNCPCIKHCDEIELDNRCMSTQDDALFFCENNADCVIKRVIEKCKEHPFKDCACGDDILQLFDIEEINK